MAATWPEKREERRRRKRERALQTCAELNENEEKK